jgi:GntR family carbon starvation induced transcriptional regulator
VIFTSLPHRDVYGAASTPRQCHGDVPTTGIKPLTMLENAQPPMLAGESGYHRIRSDIILGVLTPSVRLRLDSMKVDYGLSINTLREVLNRLASEGFVVAEAQRGFEVAPVSIQNLRELAQLRILLEQYAMTASFQAGDMEWEGRVVSAHHKLAATERIIRAEGDLPELRKRYDSEFHQALISNCGSQELVNMHAIVFDKYFRYTLQYAGRSTVEQHQALLDCALARDVDRAKLVLVAHINQCVDHALATGTLR